MIAYRGKATNAEILRWRSNFNDFIRVIVLTPSLFLFISALHLWHLYMQKQKLNKNHQKTSITQQHHKKEQIIIYD